MPEPPRFIRFLVKGSVLISMFIAGCGAVPVNEFSAYKESFDQALILISERESSESRTPSNPQSNVGDLIRPKLAELATLSKN